MVSCNLPIQCFTTGNLAPTGGVFDSSGVDVGNGDDLGFYMVKVMARGGGRFQIFFFKRFFYAVRGEKHCIRPNQAYHTIQPQPIKRNQSILNHTYQTKESKPIILNFMNY